MDWNQDLVTVAVDSHRVIVVFVLVDSGGELNVDVFGHARRNHALLLVPNFEVARLRRQDVKPLRRWRVVYQAQFHGVRFICLETSELDDAGGGTENAIGAHSVVDVLLGNGDALVGFGLCDEAPLQLNLVLTVRRRLAAQALFKLVAVRVV